MVYYDFTAAQSGKGELPPASLESGNLLFIVCGASEVGGLREGFGFDESTILECTDLDESVRYASFEGYDFVSAILLKDERFLPEELNFYAAPGYRVLVLPNEPSETALWLSDALEKYAQAQLARRDDDVLNRLYYMFWQGLLAQYSDRLERLEDEMELLSEQLSGGGEKQPFNSVEIMRRRSYAAKKYLRALSYLGAQMVTDGNELLDKKHARLFTGVEIRIRRLYDFAESLYSLSAELLDTTQSRITLRTNEIMNKLTFITLFFAPLTVITGIYGMNFKYMPELNWRVGYPAAIGVMVLVCVLLWLLAKRKKWI
ncbi:MAG: hypothetical protein LBQ80_00780 [Clostridium sp.]|jgi:magnesium transporter|nr:hypothetical protein [Clostridium sp.]